MFADYIKINNLGDKWEVDSAALIGYHLGKQPDRRALATLAENGITDYKHKVRKVRKLLSLDQVSCFNNVVFRIDII